MTDNEGAAEVRQQDSMTTGNESAAESVSAETPEPVDSAEPAVVVQGRRLPGRAGALVFRAVVAIILCAAVASSVVFYLQNRGARATIDANADARAAACKYAPVLADYDAKNLDTYFAAVLDGATGDWKKQFDSTSKELREVLTQGAVVSKVNDVQCAVKTGDENSAEAIVVIGQTITSLGTQGKPAPGQLSMVMRLAKVDGRWLVNKVNSPLAPPLQQ
jgi:Mce-associated membrane protein